MDYFTNVTYLTLEGLVELQMYRSAYFVFFLVIYILIICCNTMVIFVIFKNKQLHEPMYILIAALFCNALLGTTAFYPKLLNDILSEGQVVSYSACTFQAFVIYTYCASEFTLLSAMAYDRYVSICKPLQYVMLVKISTVKKLCFFSWFVPFCEIGGGLILTYRLHLCQFRLNRIYCDNFSIVKLSCGDTYVNNLYGIVILTIAIFPTVLFIIFSYIRILVICLLRSKDFRRKALQTCFPHLFIFISYSFSTFFEVINNRIDSDMPQIFRMVLSVEILVIPPLFNPLIYGLKLQEILKQIKKIFWIKRSKKVFV